MFSNRIAVWPAVRMVVESAKLFAWIVFLGLLDHIAAGRPNSRMDRRTDCGRCDNGSERPTNGTNTALC